MNTKSIFRFPLAVLAAIFSITANGVSNSIPEPIDTIAPNLSRSEARESGQVSVRATINQFGYVVDAVIFESTNSALNRASLEAIRRWSFKPAKESGSPVSATIIQPFNYNQGVIDIAQKKLNDRGPRATRKIAPTLPAELQNARGRVVLEASILANGDVDMVSVRHSSHPELESSAITALRSWAFKHAIKDGEAVASRVIVPFHFAGSEDPIALRESAKTIAAVDRAPKALRRFEPQLPAEISEESGAVRILAVVDEYGYVAHTEVIESDSDGLSVAATEALERWKFRPALENGIPVASKIVQPFRFNDGVFLAEREIDKHPTLVSRRSPRLPASVSGISGRVQVQLHIDEAGKVAHADIKSSTHPVLNDATLEAAKSWKFKPALKKGEAVSSTVVVPFIFGQG